MAPKQSNQDSQIMNYYNYGIKNSEQTFTNKIGNKQNTHFSTVI